MKKNVTEQLKNLEYALSYEGLFRSALKCSKGVKWKGSVSHYLLNISKETHKLYTQIHNGTYKEPPHKTFIIHEPKERTILNLAFRDRVFQRSLCDNVIYPEMSRHFIYSNCACQKRKGTDFARNLLKTYIHEFKKQYKESDRYILHIDISKYYPTMSHKVAMDTFSKYLCKDVMQYVKSILDNFSGEIGFEAGGQIVQILGISVLNDLDHFIKEKLKVKYYIRYMDDMILLGSAKELNEWLEAICGELHKIGFTTSPSKTVITPLHKGTDFLGFVFKIKGNRLLCVVKASNLKNRRRKLRVLLKLGIDLHKIDEMQTCYYNHISKGSSNGALNSSKFYYNKLKSSYTST